MAPSCAIAVLWEPVATCTLRQDAVGAVPKHAPCLCRYWKRMRAADKFLGGVDGNGTTFMQVGRHRRWTSLEYTRPPFWQT